MRARRIILTIFVFLLSLYPAAAQQLPEIRRIGILADGGKKQRLEVFKHRLGELGWLEGRNIAFEYRWADGNDDRLPTLAAELIRLKVDILVATNPRSGPGTNKD